MTNNQSSTNKTQTYINGKHFKPTLRSTTTAAKLNVSASAQNTTNAFRTLPVNVANRDWVTVRKPIVISEFWYWAQKVKSC